VHGLSHTAAAGPQILTHMREKLQFVEGDNVKLDAGEWAGRSPHCTRNVMHCGPSLMLAR
jgi:hypothetical protein